MSKEPLSYISFFINDEMLGIRINQVQEIVMPLPIYPVAISAPSVSGVINLRGQVVTAIDLREKFLTKSNIPSSECMNVIVKEGDELFSFLVDKIGDGVDFDRSELDPAPATLNRIWQGCCDGVYKMEKHLLVAINPSNVVNRIQSEFN